MKKEIKVSKLHYLDTPGVGKEIFAHISDEVPCVEFTMKGDCRQKIFEAVNANRMVKYGYEPWIQFPPKKWDEMMDKIFQEMVDVWNEKYSKK